MPPQHRLVSQPIHPVCDLLAVLIGGRHGCREKPWRLVLQLGNAAIGPLFFPVGRTFSTDRGTGGQHRQ